MWLRGVLTLACLTLAGAAFALRDCVVSTIGDPLGLCPTVDSVNVPNPLMVSGGLAGMALLGLALVWLPYVRDRLRQRKARPEERLIENIGRLDQYSRLHDDEESPPVSEASPMDETPSTFGSFTTDEASTPAEVPSIDVSTAVSEFTERVDALEMAFDTDSLDSRSLTTEWMRLLQEANRLHNLGTLPTDDFKELNTRLLHVVDGPNERASRPVETSSV